MRTMCIPGTDVLVAHEQAALEIGELRRKGIHCHLEEHADQSGHHVEVVLEPASGSPEERRGVGERNP
jgi:hypothetical protein